MSKIYIYEKLMKEYKNPYGVAGLMGNIQAESNFKSTNLQNTYEKKLGYTDESYTESVDDGKYVNFVRDAAGYGLAQWTYWSRKQALLDFCRSRKVSIGDLDAQIDFMIKEIKGYKTVDNAIRTCKSVREASDIVLKQYERPANQGTSVQIQRAKYGTAIFNEFNKLEVKEDTVDIDALARDVIAGKYGNGQERKDKLGKLYSKVQKRVNEMLKG